MHEVPCRMLSSHLLSKGEISCLAECLTSAWGLWETRLSVPALETWAGAPGRLALVCIFLCTTGCFGFFKET